MDGFFVAMNWCIWFYHRKILKETQNIKNIQIFKYFKCSSQPPTSDVNIRVTNTTLVVKWCKQISDVRWLLLRCGFCVDLHHMSSKSKVINKQKGCEADFWHSNLVLSQSTQLKRLICLSEMRKHIKWRYMSLGKLCIQNLM